MKHKSKVLAVSAAIAVGLSLFIATPADACEDPHPAPSSSASAAPSALATVRVTQQGTGSFFGLLEWPAVTGATEYRIFKTGSIRPRWRLFWVAPSSVTMKTISDKPGAIAIYRVVALVKNKEIDLGEFTYIPVR